MNDSMFSQIDFGILKEYLDNDDITDISYSNGGQIWIKTLSKGLYRAENISIDNAFMEKLGFQCANVMGKSFNMAHPFLDAEGAELRLNFVHDSIAQNGIAVVIRKTPAKIRLVKENLLAEHYIDLDIHDFLLECVKGHCNIIVCGETGSGKTEFVKYLASHTKIDEKLITIEDTLELHLDKIYPNRDIITMKTNNIASYTDVLVTCMRQNPKWILLSEVRSAEAVMAVRNSISSGHYILSTIHADKASSIPNRMYSLLETNQDVEQFLKSIYRYIQIGVYIRAYQDRITKKFHREIAEVTEFYVTEDNEAEFNTIYKKSTTGHVVKKAPTKYLNDYLDAQGIVLPENMIVPGETFENINVTGKEHQELSQQATMQPLSSRVTTTASPATQVQPQVVIPNQGQQSQVVIQTQPVSNQNYVGVSPQVRTIQSTVQQQFGQKIPVQQAAIPNQQNVQTIPIQQPIVNSQQNVQRPIVSNVGQTISPALSIPDGNNNI